VTATGSHEPATAGEPASSGAVAMVDTEAVRMRVHPGVCEGWGLCHRFGGLIFPLDAEGYLDVHLVELPAEYADAARLGASVCPAQAISIIAVTDPRRG